MTAVLPYDIVIFAPQSAEELRDKLRTILPINSRDAALHSMQVMSTMPQVIAISAPVAVRSSGVRPP